MNKTLQIIILICISFQFGSAQETFKAMFYNVLNYPDQAPASRLQDLVIILDDYKPDIFMICELNNETGADNILTELQNINPNFQRAAFHNNTSDDNIGDQNDLQNMIFYDSSKFILEIVNPGGMVDDQVIVQTNFRDFNHYKLKLNSTQQATNPIFLDAIVCHLKSSSGSVNEGHRLDMVEELMSYLETVSSNSYIMLAGDFNVYTNSEPAFDELLFGTTTSGEPNNIAFVDPANRTGSWHNNVNYVDVMTQSTRLSGSGLGGAGGGFDDRFDFILTSENMQSASELSYVNGSYQVYGNNDNILCYDDEIRSVNCSGPEFSAAIRTSLYNFSDHLPVTLELQTDQTLSNPSFTFEDSIKIIGTNIIENTIKLKVNNQSLNINQLIIYNVLGQNVKTISLNNSVYFTEDLSGLNSGIYYITAPRANMNPIKFIKVD